MQLSNLSTWLISGRICVYYTISSISLGVQTVKNMPAIWDQEDPCRRAWQPTPVFLSGESMDRGAWWTTVHVVQRFGHDWVTNTHIYYITTLRDLSYPKHQKAWDVQQKDLEIWFYAKCPWTFLVQAMWFCTEPNAQEPLEWIKCCLEVLDRTKHFSSLVKHNFEQKKE